MVILLLRNLGKGNKGRLAFILKGTLNKENSLEYIPCTLNKIKQSMNYKIFEEESDE